MVSAERVERMPRTKRSGSIDQVRELALKITVENSQFSPFFGDPSRFRRLDDLEAIGHSGTILARLTIYIIVFALDEVNKFFQR